MMMLTWQHTNQQCPSSYPEIFIGCMQMYVQSEVDDLLQISFMMMYSSSSIQEEEEEVPSSLLLLLLS
jgi:hypothetical protein